MNVNDLEVYNDVGTDREQSNTPNPWTNTPFSNSFNTPYTTPRLEESGLFLKKIVILKKLGNTKFYHTTNSKNFKNLSFVSNDSTNYESENLTLNSYRLSQINNMNENNGVNASVFLNQSLNNSGNNSSRRNTFENIKNQDYSSFLNEWKNMHYYHKNSATIENNECLNIVPEDLNEENLVKLTKNRIYFFKIENLLSIRKRKKNI